MTREEKNQMIDRLTDQLNNNSTIYLADISELNADQSSKLRGLCHSRQVSLEVVKNRLLKKALEKVEGKDLIEFKELLVGNTSLMFSESASAPAKLIKEFRMRNDKPILKGAYIEENIYIGDQELGKLAELKSKNEIIADIVMLLQSPAKNIISALQSGGYIITGLLKSLGDRQEAENSNEVIGPETKEGPVDANKEEMSKVDISNESSEEETNQKRESKSEAKSGEEDENEVVDEDEQKALVDELSDKSPDEENKESE